jgi:predicted nucleotidyltransferase
VQALRPSVVSAAIYGSFARREAHEHSDVDLLLVTSGEGSYAWDEQVHELQARFLAWTGNRLEVLALQAPDLQRIVTAGEPLVASLRSDALTLTGTELAALLTPARRRRKVAAR